MVMFETEKDLIQKLNEHFIYAKDFALNNLSFTEFQKYYNNFYFTYVLSGSESDKEEKELLAKYKNKVLFHDKVAGILSNLCSDKDALKESYKNAGRYNSEISRLKILHLINEFNIEYQDAI